VLRGAGSTATVTPDQVVSAARRILSTVGGRRGSSGFPRLSRSTLFGALSRSSPA